MKLARVEGRVWATVKDPKLDSIKLSIIQPVNEDGSPLGHTLIAADMIGSRDGDLVYWVSGAEATFPLENRQIPSDVTIVGLVDKLNC
jgi:ethanolamine utilization protein EutN